MSDTPSPAPAPESKPKLTLTPKAPAAPADAPASAGEAPIPPPSSPMLQTGVGSSNATPPALAAASAKPTLKPAFKLQSTPHPANAPAPAFKSPMPVAADDQPSVALVALAFIAAAAAITFAVLLYLKNQQ